MITIFGTNKPIYIEHKKAVGQMLMNSISFTIGLQNNDYTTFSPEVKEQINNDSKWLSNMVKWLQLTIIESLMKQENYHDEQELFQEYNVLLTLYKLSKERKLDKEEDNLFKNIYDKFLALLLSDLNLLNKLHLPVDYNKKGVTEW